MCQCRHHRGERGDSGATPAASERRARHPDTYLAAVNRFSDGMREEAA
jgi:hypothetical protein